MSSVKKRALIVGVATNRSIASYIAKSLHESGFELAFTCQNKRLKEKVLDIARDFGSEIVLECDVSLEDSIASMYDTLKNHWTEGFDVLIHSVAYAPREELNGDFVANTTKNGFMVAHEISSYSLLGLVQAAKNLSLLRDNGSIITLSYLGSERYVPNYNIMGLAKASLEANVRYMAASLGSSRIRVNAISAGAIRTLAASGISGFRNMLEHYAKQTPLKSNVNPEHVGATAAFLASEAAGGITGQIIYVDNGYNITSI